VYSAANRCADLFKKFVGLVVFFGIALSVIPIIGIRLLAYFFKDIFTKSTIQNTKQKYPIKLNNLKYKNLIGNKHNNKLHRKSQSTCCIYTPYNRWNVI
jgi:ABC-type lipoprotein release transport system permease subunit